MTASVPEGRPQAVLDVFDTLTAPVPVDGRAALRALALSAAEAGFDNDMMLRILSAASDAWGLLPGRYERWSGLMNMLRAARKEFPNCSEGTGWKAPK